MIQGKIVPNQRIYCFVNENSKTVESDAKIRYLLSILFVHNIHKHSLNVKPTMYCVEKILWKKHYPISNMSIFYPPKS